jgi:hypothetical protein
MRVHNRRVRAGVQPWMGRRVGTGGRGCEVGEVVVMVMMMMMMMTIIIVVVHVVRKGGVNKLRHPSRDAEGARIGGG